MESDINNFCTLFDRKYLLRGLAMYESLKKHSNNFHLYIFAFDNISESILKKLNLEHCTIISLKEFEDEELLKLKKLRSVAEYCWTCTPSTIKYAIERFKLKSCTYLDADVYFFSDPKVLMDEMGDNSVLITEHRYTPEYDQSATSGIYCVQFITFNNNKKGMEVLNWWRDACNNWCYAKFEEGKFGDQKYLDDWTKRFDCVHVLKNLGGGIAPWNVQQYDIKNIDFDIIFYHFHNLKFLGKNKVDLGSYKINSSVVELIYKPYINHLKKILVELNIARELNDFPEKSLKIIFRYFKRYLQGNLNIYNLNDIT